MREDGVGRLGRGRRGSEREWWREEGGSDEGRGRRE